MAGRQKSDAKREAILAAASDEFAERDFHAVLMEDVAARAGVGKGTLYRYFPTKEELFVSSVARRLDESHQEFIRMLGGDASLENLLRAAMSKMLEYFAGKPQLLTLLQRYEDRLPEGEARAWQERRTSVTDAVARAIDRERRAVRGADVDSTLAAHVFLGMARTAIQVLGGDASQKRRDAVAKELVTLFLSGCGVRPAEPVRRRTAGTRAGLAAVGVALAASLSLLACSGSGDVDARAEQKEETPAIAVTTELAAVQSLERTVDFVGTLHADARAEVAAEVEGRLLEVKVDLGDQVEADQVLATLAGAELEAKLAEAEAVFERSKRDEERARRLRDQGVISPQEFDELTSALDVAQARREVLAIQVEKTKVRAPFRGRIAQRLVDVGNYVRTGTTLYVLVADDPLRLRGEIPERYSAELEPGDPVRARAAAYPDLVIHGRVTRISPAADPEHRALTIEALVPNAEGRLKPGFFAKAEVITGVDDQVVVIPAEGLIEYAGVERVFVIDEEGTARSRTVHAGTRLGTRVEILEGLSAGDRIATSGLTHLVDGARVTEREARLDDETNS
ncbi:MAG: efflux RND transporter periplasmic adaptor subunit [Deltaproteobacteria bacterium]|nr:efflux RND transporter periplasmic adaptor subunit [Deltaproteobacteria bacterium]